MLPFMEIVPRAGVRLRGNSHHEEQGSFRMLFNMKLAPGGGALMQTNYFREALGWSAGTYYNGSGTSSEPSASSTTSPLVVAVGTDIYSFGFVPRKNTTQLQVVTQSAVPTGEAAIHRCLLVINDYSALGLALGDTVDVEIDGTDTFKWRVAGGAYTTGVTINATDGNSIASGAATVYWLASTGFTVTDVWQWTRTDYLYEGSSTHWTSYNNSYRILDNRIYFISLSGRVMVYENGGIRSVGYRPIYGTELLVAYNTLFVGNAADAIFTDRSGVLQTSDNGNLDNFLPTDLNEADTYPLNSSASPGAYISNFNGICGLSLINSSIFVFTVKGVYVSLYLGLPVPFNFLPYKPFTPASFFTRPAETSDGVYLATTRGLEFFDGAGFTVISDNIQQIVDPSSNSSNLFYIYWAAYDPHRREVYYYLSRQLPEVHTASTQWLLVFQEQNREWYFRDAATGATTRTLCATPSGVNLPYPLKVLDDVYASGTLYTSHPPVAVLQDIVSSPFASYSDLDSFDLDASFLAASWNYDQSNIVVEAHCAGNSITSTSPTYVTAAPAWTDTSLPKMTLRKPFRVCRIRIRGVAAGSLLRCNQMKINTLQINLRMAKTPNR